jgi:hypothetical protein
MNGVSDDSLFALTFQVCPSTPMAIFSATKLIIQEPGHPNSAAQLSHTWTEISKETSLFPSSHDALMIHDPGVYVSQSRLDIGLSIKLHNEGTALESSSPCHFPAQSAESVQTTKDSSFVNKPPHSAKTISRTKRLKSAPLEEVKRKRCSTNSHRNGSRQQVFKGPGFQPPVKKSVVRREPGKPICVQCRAKKIRVSEQCNFVAEF